jgi:hypothetical protein
MHENIAMNLGVARTQGFVQNGGGLLFWEDDTALK